MGKAASNISPMKIDFCSESILEAVQL